MGGRGLGASGLPVHQIPEIPLKLVRSVEITANFSRCKQYFEKFCEEAQGMEACTAADVEHTERKLAFSAISAILCVFWLKILDGECD